MKNIFCELTKLIQQFSYILTKKQKRYSAGLLVLLMIGALFETLGISMVVPLIQSMLEPEKLLNNEVLRPLWNMLHVADEQSLIVWLCVGTVSIYIIKNIYLIGLSYIKVKFACMVQQELSVSVMQSYMKRDYIFFTRVNSSELLRGVGEDVNRVYNMLSQGFRVLTEALTSAMIVAYIVYTDAIMAISILILSVVSFGVIAYFFKGRMKKMGRLRQYYDAKTRKIAFELILGIKEVMILGCKKFFVDNYESSYHDQQRAVISETVANESPAYMIEAVCVSGLIGVVGYRILLGNNIANLIPQFAAFAVAAFRVLPSIARITSSYNVMVFNKPGFDTIYTNLHEINMFQEEAEDKKDDRVAEKGSFSFSDKLELKDISWSYPGNKAIILDNVNLTIEKGKAVGIIGESGAGKTTLMDILLGLLLPEEGKVLVDGININNLTIQRNRIIGYVSQSIFLLDDTLRNNIAFGIPEDKIDEKRIEQAIEQAQLKDFISQLSEGLNTLVGERGTRLSGGQRQRVAIARALYYDPQILVLDEATSALDNKTESAVMEAIENLQGKKTLIIVAHRLTTIEKCDEVYEVKDKEIVRKR